MTPEQATFVLQMTLPSIENESKTTRKVLAAVPADKGSYTPHEKSMTAMDLTWHIASSEVWFLNGVAAADFSQPSGDRPAEIKTPADVVAWYDKNLPAAVEKVKALKGDHLAKPVSFFGVMNYPDVVYLNFLVNHTVHHRGQLSTYLRPMGAKVPSIYGGSADEPFQMEAQA